MAIIRAIPRLKCDLNFGLPVLGVLGFIYSEWATSYIRNGKRVFCYDYFHRDIYTIDMMKSYYLFSIVTSIMLYCGFKYTNPKLIKYWRVMKYTEIGFIITGIILFLFTSRWYTYWPYYPVAVVLLGAGRYLINTVQKGYSEVGIEVESLTVSNEFENTKCQNQDSPPPYEEKTPENFNPEVANALAFMGYIKLFELVLIVPAIIFIIRTPIIFGYYNYWKIFWLYAGLGLCIILYVRFISKMILLKTTCDKLEEEDKEELIIKSMESTST